MKFEVDGDSVFVNIQSITSVSVSERTEYSGENRKAVFYVEVSAIGQMLIPVYQSTSKENAKSMQEKIGAVMDKLDPEKTYLKGFKDGTEYALKLMDKK